MRVPRLERPLVVQGTFDNELIRVVFLALEDAYVERRSYDRLGNERWMAEPAERCTEMLAMVALKLPGLSAAYESLYQHVRRRHSDGKELDFIDLDAWWPVPEPVAALIPTTPEEGDEPAAGDMVKEMVTYESPPEDAPDDGDLFL